MGAPLVSKERLPDPEQILKPVRTMQTMIGCRFHAVMTSEIGGENGLIPFFVAALAGIPVLDADPRGRGRNHGHARGEDSRSRTPAGR